MYFHTFLSYKPEQMFLAESDDDLEIALRAMSKEVAPLAEFAVVIQDDKFEKYLRTVKLGKMMKAARDLISVVDQLTAKNAVCRIAVERLEHCVASGQRDTNTKRPPPSVSL